MVLLGVVFDLDAWCSSGYFRVLGFCGLLCIKFFVLVIWFVVWFCVGGWFGLTRGFSVLWACYGIDFSVFGVFGYCLVVDVWILVGASWWCSLILVGLLVWVVLGFGGVLGCLCCLPKDFAFPWSGVVSMAWGLDLMVS